MKNLFLSPNGLLKNCFNKLETIQSEQRFQRMDLASMKRTLDYIIKIMNHQDTMDYFSKKYGEELGRSASGQSSLDEHE